MIAALLFLPGYQFWGQQEHEWVGMGMFALFITHQLLNRNWYQNLARGRYTPERVLQVGTNFLVFVSMLALMYSGIVLSRLFPLEGGLAMARRLHMLGSYWGFILMSAHLGLHWNMFINLGKKLTGLKKPSTISAAALQIAGALIAGYGLVAFIKRDFLTCLLLRSEFLFLDYDEPVVLFYFDYLAVMGLCIFVGRYLAKLFRKIGAPKVSEKIIS